MGEFSRYRPLVGDLARQAMVVAEAALAPVAGHADARLGLPAARLLLDDAPSADRVSPGSDWYQALSVLSEIALHTGAGDRPLRSPGGQWRDVYHPLVVHLYLRSFARVRRTVDAGEATRCHALLSQSAAPLVSATDEQTDGATARSRRPAGAGRAIAFRLWRALCLFELDELASPADPAPVVSAVDWLLSREGAGGPDGSLHALDEDEPLDFWTYRELAGLHALARLAMAGDRPAWKQRVDDITAFHLAHTQPDYTTYEPWALFAFARSPHTALFAEQQLHDATTHLGRSSASAALMVGLLLADAYDAMQPTA